MRLGLMARSALVLAFGITMLTGPARAADEQRFVHIRGSTTMLPMAQRVAEAYMAEQPEVTVVVSGGGTQRGYKSIMDGTADIGMASAPMTDDLKKISERRSKVNIILIGYSAVVPIVHPSNPMNSLTTDQLKLIFRATARDWQNVGGPAKPIALYALPQNEATAENWDEAILGENETVSHKAIVVAEAEICKKVAADPNAIGFVGLSFLKPGVKVLAIDGIAATPETIRKREFPVRRAISMVTSDDPSRATMDFVKYFKDPKKGLQFADIIKIVPVE